MSTYFKGVPSDLLLQRVPSAIQNVPKPPMQCIGLGTKPTANTLGRLVVPSYEI